MFNSPLQYNGEVRRGNLDIKLCGKQAQVELGKKTSNTMQATKKPA